MLMTLFVKWNHLVLAVILSLFVSAFFIRCGHFVLAPSISSHQKLVPTCERLLGLLFILISPCGPKYAGECSVIKTLDGSHQHWVDNLRYLGIYIVSGKTVRNCFDNVKKL